MPQEYKTLMHQWFEEVWNEQSEDAIDRMCSEDIVAYGLSDTEGNTIRGIDSYKIFFRTFVSAYPDMKITVEDTVSEGNKIAARCRITAIHAGVGLGIAPTNQPVEFTGMTIARVEDGKIVEAWNEFDFMKMYAQVGALDLHLQYEDTLIS